MNRADARRRRGVAEARDFITGLTGQDTSKTDG